MGKGGSVRWLLLKEFRTAFLIPVTKPPTNRLSRGDSSFMEPPSEEPASVGPAVARNGTPGSTLKVAAPPGYKLAGGGGAGDQRVWERSRDRWEEGVRSPSKSICVNVPGRAGDSESHRGDGTKTGFLFGEGTILRGEALKRG